jgi:hypothetical protein
MRYRVISTIAIGTVIIFVLSSCGGSGDGSSGAGGSGLSISMVAPSLISVGVPQGSVNVYGQGFTQQSQVLIDGQPAPLTILADKDTLQVEVPQTFAQNVGTHQIVVQDDGNLSNTVTCTIYAPQQGSFGMQAIPTFLAGEQESEPPYVVAADVNGDGLADVIINGDGLVGSEGIAILYGQPDGTLAAPVQIPVPNFPYALAAGDVDGNGTPDLITLTSLNDVNGSTTVSILSGDGHGNFQPPVMQQTIPGIAPVSPYLADLDGDGKPDLVFVDQDGSGVHDSIYWLKNTGGGFAPGIKLAAAGRRILSIGDFNGDGKPDIIYETTTLAMHILLNNSNGKFTDQVAAGLTGLNGIVGVPNVLDFNLDGIPDLVIEVSTSTGDQLYSFQGNGDGSFTQIAVLSCPPVGQLVIGDFDHDGFPDLAGPGSNEPGAMTYFFGDGHGHFVAQQVVGPAGQYVAVGDFNGDGIPDLVIPDDFSFAEFLD